MLIKIGYNFFLIDADEDTFYSSFVGWQRFVQYIRMLYLGFIDLNRTVLLNPTTNFRNRINCLKEIIRKLIFIFTSCALDT